MNTYFSLSLSLSLAHSLVPGATLVCLVTCRVVVCGVAVESQTEIDQQRV